MLYFSKWKTIIILGLVALGFLFALPNAIPEKTRESLPSQFQRTINLGLDLQGGAHMLLEVELSSVLELETQNLRDTVRGALQDAGRLRTDYLRVEDGAVVGKFRNPDDVEAGYRALDGVPEQVDQTQLAGPKDSRVEKIAPDRFRVTITEDHSEGSDA
jgi:preprotein translocase subunit SecD